MKLVLFLAVGLALFSNAFALADGILLDSAAEAKGKVKGDLLADLDLLQVSSSVKAEVMAKIESKESLRLERSNRLLLEKYGDLKIALFNRVENMEDFLARLELRGFNVSSELALVANLSARIEALNANASVSEARALLADARLQWALILNASKKKAEEVEKNKTKENIERAKGLFARIEAVILKLKAEGVVTASFETRLSTIKSKLAEADGKYGQEVRLAAVLLHEVNAEFLKLKLDLKAKVLKEKSDARVEAKIKALEAKIKELRAKLVLKVKTKISVNATAGGNASASSAASSTTSASSTTQSSGGAGSSSAGGEGSSGVGVNGTVNISVG